MTPAENEIVSQLTYTVDQAAAALNSSRNTIYGEIASGRLKSIKHGKRRLIAHVDLVAFINALRMDAEASSARKGAKS